MSSSYQQYSLKNQIIPYGNINSLFLPKQKGFHAAEFCILSWQLLVSIQLLHPESELREKEREKSAPHTSVQSKISLCTQCSVKKGNCQILIFKSKQANNLGLSVCLSFYLIMTLSE